MPQSLARMVAMLTTAPEKGESCSALLVETRTSLVFAQQDGCEGHPGWIQPGGLLYSLAVSTGTPRMPIAALPQNPTLFLLSLGCPKNRVDSEIMLGSLLQKGYQLVENAADAEVVLINPCAFIGEAKQESIDAILEHAQLKETGKCKALVVAGCLTQRYAEVLQNELPEVDYFVGTSAYPRIAEIIRGERDRAVIPDLVEEAPRLVEEGAVELNLVAQDLTAYGHDLPGRPKLHELLQALGEVKARWIRLHYAYPRGFPDALIEALASQPNVARS